MKLARGALALAALGLVSGLAYVAQQTEASSGPDMVTAAKKLVDALDQGQRAKAVLAFDSPERSKWHFVPLEADGKPTRKGLPLEEMTAEQKKAALALVRAGTSPQGEVAAVTIMSLESILKELEKKGPTRNPEWYFFTVFGTPSKTGNWGWRVEGHHLSLNFTLEGTQVASATPSFFGANPAEIKAGPKKGVRVLDPTEQLAFELFKALDDGQRQAAHREKHFPEPQAQTAKPSLGEPVGLSAAKMTPGQRDTLAKLLKAYTDRMPPDVGAVELKRATDSLDKVHFAFTGAAEHGKAHTYRVHGPTFVIEFLNVQADSAGNPANHIHSVWRHTLGDFGTDKSGKSSG
jgi:hypothetical protein